MDFFESNIIKVTKNKSITKLAAFIGVICFIGIIFMLKFPNNNIIIWSSVICMLVFAFFLRKIHSPIPNPLDYSIGKIIISDTIIKINKKTYELKSLKKITLIVNNYLGEKIDNIEEVTISDGTNNTISFFYTDNFYEFNFIITSQTSKKKLSNVLSKWYDNKITFYEGTSGGKTYCTEMLNYQQIQELKRIHKIN